MRYILTLLLFSTLTSAVETSVILARQKEATFPDTAEIRMRTTVTMQGMPAQTMESRLISKGAENRNNFSPKTKFYFGCSI